MVDEEESLTNLCSTYAKMCSASYSSKSPESYVLDQMSAAAAAAVPVHAMHRWPSNSRLIGHAADALRALSCNDRSRVHIEKLQGIYIFFELLNGGLKPNAALSVMNVIANLVEMKKVRNQAKNIQKPAPAVDILLDTLVNTPPVDMQLLLQTSKVLGVVVRDPEDKEGEKIQ